MVKPPTKTENNHPHPGIFVREEILAPLGMTITKGAEIMGIRRTTLSDLVNGKSALSLRMALRMEKAFGVRREVLLKKQSLYSGKKSWYSEQVDDD